MCNATVPGGRAVVARLIFVALIVQVSFVPPVRSAKVRHDHAIRKIFVSPTSVDPSSGETATLHVALARAARPDVQILDRDGFVIRTLPAKNADESNKRRH
jgi:hypothetical protein